MSIPCKMRPAGLESLPMGYIRLDFLESTGTQYIKTPLIPEGLSTHIQFEITTRKQTTVFGYYRSGSERYQIWTRWNGGGTGVEAAIQTAESSGIISIYDKPLGYIADVEVNAEEGFISIGDSKKNVAQLATGFSSGAKDFGIFTQGTTSAAHATTRIYFVRCWRQGEDGHNWQPTLDSTGTPCLFDLVTRTPLYNAATTGSDFVAGLTMAQALNLANLPVPTTSNTLTISLPKEATLVQYNQEVNAAIAAAEGKGWSITVKYRDKFDDASILNKYAECVTLLDVSEVNPDWDNDITSDGEWIYPLTNAVSLYDNANFGYSGMFSHTKATRIYVDAPKLTTANYLISGNSNVKYAYLNMPTMARIFYIAMHNSAIEEIEGYMPNAHQVDITHSFNSNCKLRSVKMDFPKLSVGESLLPGAILDKESTLRILNSIPRWTSGTHKLTIGIHVDNKYDPEVNEALKRADANYEPLNLPIDETTGEYVEVTENKGWQLTVQWNGTATENAYPNPSATYSLRPQASPVYAKLVTEELPDGTIEDYLDWGHYVTNWEENGYQEFTSLEEAYAHFNLEMPAEE